MLRGKENPNMVVRRKRKNPHAVAMSRLGNAARMKALSPERRSEIARIAAVARWSKRRAKAERTPHG
jgi:hypothetical protein